MHSQTLTLSALAVATISSPAQELPAPKAPKKVSRFAAANAKALAEGTLTQFDHPTTFAEFFEREPRYVSKWLKSKKCPVDLFEDFEHELLVHLMTAPGMKSEHYGKPDWVSTYVPEKMGGFGTRWAWAAFMNRMLSTQYGKLINRNNRGGVRGEHVVSLSEDGFGDGGPVYGNTSGMPSIILRNQGDLQHFTALPVNAPSKIFMEKFLAHVQDELGQSHVTYLRAVLAADAPAEVEALTGLSKHQCSRYRRDLKLLAAQFTKVRRARVHYA